MSLHLLPEELKLEIISHLDSDADKQCLRLTCSNFLGIIPKSPNPCDGQTDMYTTAGEDWMSFLFRLQRPGNLYDAQGMCACSMCGYFRKRADFKGMLIIATDGRLAWKKCGINRLHLDVERFESPLRYRGVQYQLCATCDFFYPEDQMRWPSWSNLGASLFCEACCVVMENRW